MARTCCHCSALALLAFFYTQAQDAVHVDGAARDAIAVVVTGQWEPNQRAFELARGYLHGFY